MAYRCAGLNADDYVADAKIAPILKPLATLDEIRDVLLHPPFPDGGSDRLSHLPPISSGNDSRLDVRESGLRSIGQKVERGERNRIVRIDTDVCQRATVQELFDLFERRSQDLVVNSSRSQFQLQSSFA